MPSNVYGASLGGADTVLKSDLGSSWTVLCLY